jgi:hypothetical protein
VTQGAWNITPSNRPCNLIFIARLVAAILAESRIRFYFWQQLLQLVSMLHFVDTSATCVSIALCRHFCNLSCNGIMTQVAWNISLSNRLCNSNFFARQVAAILAESRIRFYFWQQLLQLVSALHRVDTSATCVSVAPCRHFCNLCRNATERKAAEKIAPCICTCRKLLIFTQF